MKEHAISTDLLLAHADWVRRLARDMVGDLDSARDVEQETWLAALRRPPRDASNLRSWFRRVVRNAAFQKGRGEVRRVDREHEVARDDVAPATDRLLEVAERQRDVVSAVLELEEPYRSTVLHVFWEERSPSAVARELGISPATVRSRLARSKEQLREKLERRFGKDEGVWQNALVPLLALPGVSGTKVALGSRTGSKGVSTVKTSPMLQAVTAGCLLLGGMFWWGTKSPAEAPRKEPEQMRAHGGVASPFPTSREERRVLQESTSSQGARREALTGGRTESAGIASVETTGPYVGFVRDREGDPIAGARVRLFNKDDSWPAGEPLAEGRTGSAGRFAIEEVEGASDYVLVAADAEGFGLVSQDPLPPGYEATIQLPYVRTVHGRVLDAETLEPVPHARVRTYTEDVQCDAQGHFALPNVRMHMHGWFLAQHPDYAIDPVEATLSDIEAPRLDFHLQRGFPVEVTFVDEWTGDPIEVRVTERHTAATLFESSGFFGFRLRDDARNLYWHINSEEHAPFHWYPEPALTGPSSYEVPLPRLAWLEGTLVDGQDQPIAGAWLYGSYPATQELQANPDAQGSLGRLVWDDRGHSRRSGENGRFALPLRKLDTPWNVRADVQGYASLEVGGVQPGPRGSTNVRWVMEPGATLRGRVLRNDLAYRGIVVAFDEEGRIRARSRIDEAGHYLLTSLPGDTCRLEVKSSYYVDEPVRSVELELARGEESRVDVIWVEELEYGEIEGRVVDARGEPLVQQAVYVYDEKRQGAGQNTETDGHGRFVVRVVEGRQYSVLTRSKLTRDCTASASQVSAGTSDLELRLPDPARLRLQLVSAGTGEPLSLRSGFETHALRLRRQGNELFRSHSMSVSVTGEIEVLLAAGTYDLRLDLARHGYRPATLSNLLLDQMDPTPQVLSLERGLDVRIELAAPGVAGASASKPWRGHLLFLVERSQRGAIEGPFADQGAPSNHRINGICMRIGDPQLMNQRLSDDAATSHLRALAPGEYELQAYPDDFVFEPARFEIPAGGAFALKVDWRAR